MKGKIKGANVALADIQNNQIKVSNDALKQAENELSVLDDELQAVRKELASGVLQKSFELARAQLELEGKLLQHARDGVVELKRADLKLQNYVKTWTGKGTQDSQMPDITDADLEHDRPTPEVAQATLDAAKATAPNGSSARPSVSVDPANALFNITVVYYAKPADSNSISDGLQKDSIKFSKLHSIGAKYERAITNALICGPDTPARAIKKVALALMHAGIGIKYIGKKSRIKSRQILIVSLLKDSHPVNYENLTSKQINALSGCPSELKIAHSGG